MKTQEGTVRGAGICWTLLLMERGLWSAVLIIYNISYISLGKKEMGLFIWLLHCKQKTGGGPKLLFRY